MLFNLVQFSSTLVFCNFKSRDNEITFSELKHTLTLCSKLKPNWFYVHFKHQSHQLCTSISSDISELRQPQFNVYYAVQGYQKYNLWAQTSNPSDLLWQRGGLWKKLQRGKAEMLEFYLNFFFRFMVFLLIFYGL